MMLPLFSFERRLHHVVVTVALATALCACSKAPDISALNSESKTVLVESDWIPVTISSAALQEKGITTGDGAQWPRSLAVAPSDGSFMLWGTDVGGLFRSLDEGRNWEPANVGFHSRGTSAMAIDPGNADRVLVAGGNSFAHRFNGIYLSENRAASWNLVLPVSHSSGQDVGRRAIAFDPSSWDPGSQATLVAYWSMLSDDKPAYGPGSEDAPGFFRTEDGGRTWERLSTSGPSPLDAHLVVQPFTGTIFAATPEGLLRSKNRGIDWEVIRPGAHTGVDLSVAAPNVIWATQAQGIFRSPDGGETWEQVVAHGIAPRADGVLRNLAASPSNPDRLVVCQVNPDWDFPRFYSHDGGVTWQRGEVHRNDTLVPSNARTALFAFHPTNPDLILAPGGDYPTLSRDGGASYCIAGCGVNNLLVGGGFAFSATDPDVLYLGSQDYGTVLTKDGGVTWQYFAPGGMTWGGFNYGAYGANGQVLFVADAKSWGGPKELMVTGDGGQSWQRTGLTLGGEPYVGAGCPKRPEVLFANQFRSADSGKSWLPMEGATHVFGHDPLHGTLYGIKRARLKGVKDRVVTSQDSGESWEEIFLPEGSVQDLAFHAGSGVFHLVENGTYRRWKDGSYLPESPLPQDQEGAIRVRSVAIDPLFPEVIYLASNRDRFSTNVAALRSLDGGESWQVLTRQNALDGFQRDGGREAQWVRVHPKTREAWFVTGCYGVWKHRPPVDEL